MYKKLITVALTAGLAVVCLSGFAACGEKKSAFDAPKNVKMEGATLTWSAVDGATNGYTVRVNEDDAKTVTVSAATLSLAEGQVVEYFTEGANKLAVKVNATDEKDESVYSTTVSYTYTTNSEPEDPENPEEPEEPEKTAFATPTGLTVSGTVLSWSAVEGAEAYVVSYGEYSVEVTAAQIDLAEKAGQLNLPDGVSVTISVKVKATDAHYESAAAEVTYQVPGVSDAEKAQAIAAAKAELQGYVDELPESESYTEEEAETVLSAVEEAEGKYADYPAYVKENSEITALYGTLTAAKETARQAIAAAELQRKIAAAKTELEGYAEELPEELTALTDAEAEEILVITAQAQESYEAYEEAVKEDDGVAALWTEISAAKTAAQSKIEGTVNALKENVLAITGSEAVTSEYYETLEGYAEQIKSLGAYANTLCDAEALAQKVSGELVRVTETVFRFEAEDTVFGFGGEGTQFIVRVYYNVLGDQIEFATAPAISYSVNDGEQKTESLVKQANGAYVGTIAFNPTEATTIRYTVGDEAEKTVSYAAFQPNIWLNDAPAGSDEYRSLFDGEDKVVINQTGAENFADIYLATDLDIGSSNNAQLSISNVPLATKIPVSNGMTRAELYRVIATTYGDVFIGKTYEVRFVFYYVSEENGVVSHSTVNNASVSEKITLSLTQEDTKENLYFASAGIDVWNDNSGIIVMGAAYNSIEKIVEQMNDVSATEISTEAALAEIRLYIDVTYRGETKRFYLPYTATLSGSAVKSNLYQLFGETAEGESYVFKFGVAVAENSAFGAYFRDSAAMTTGITASLTVSRSDASASSEAQFRFTGDGNYIELVRAGANGKAFDDGASYIALTATKGEVTFTVYMLKVGNSLYLCTETELNDSALQCDTYNNGYTLTATFNDWVKRVLADTVGSEFNAADGEWEFRTKVYTDGSVYPYDGELSEPVKYTTAG